MNKFVRLFLPPFLFISLAPAFTWASPPSYLPVVLVSGINADHVNLKPLAQHIRKHLPGIYVKNVQIGLGKITSFWNMYDQAEWLAYELYTDYNLRNGCNIVAHSQGGLTARYFIERFNYPRVYNYIALGSPQRGVSGTPSKIDNKYIWLNLLETYISTILYMPAFQRCVSFAGYWNDSLRHSEYLKKCSFLPYLNNEREHEFSQVFKDNICRLQNMVLVKSYKEEIVEPAESCHFGYYKRGSVHQVEDIFASDIYQKDMLGLKTLYETGRLHLKEANCYHKYFQEDEHNFIENVLPFLTLDPNRVETIQELEIPA